MRREDYFVGFDVGTGSVGWAVTDIHYNLLNINRKKAWGSVLFDSSQGAEARRMSRCARRRLKRRNERLNLLRELFEDEIYKVDSGFFHRLKESRYVYDDKRNTDGEKPDLPYSLFTDKDYTDVEYHKEFPTIYHLRKALMLENRSFDVRLVYLAIAGILKNRGHFLANMDIDDSNMDFEDIFKDLIETWNIYCTDESQLHMIEEQLKSIESILKNPGKTKTLKKQEIIHVLNNTDKQIKELAALMTGGTVSLAKLFCQPEFEALEENKITFDDSSYEEKEEIYAADLGDYFDVIIKTRAVYTWMVLSGIVKKDDSNKEGYLSVAKVESYEKHKYELNLLKKAIRNSSILSEEERKSLYKKTFGYPEKGVNNYSKYIGSFSRNGKKKYIEGGKCSKDDFYKFINKQVLPYIDDGETKDYITEQISLLTFLSKQRETENSIIPYQMNARELKIILSNAENYLPFLKVRDEKGYSISDKIMMLLTFRVPYYVGPLNPSHSNSWIVKNEGIKEKITPWNFNDIVDTDASAEKFIRRMTSKCTYLKNEDVLPAASLLYERYKVLNELNNLKVYSRPLEVDVKQRIYERLFERKLRVTLKNIIEYLKKEETGFTNLTKDDISGIDIEIKSSLRSYHAFKREFTNCSITEKQKEDIIKDMTLFGAEPDLLKERLVKKYPQYEKQVKALMRSYSCKDWGRLSEKFLNGIAVEEKGQGKIGTIIYKLWNTDLNLQMIVASKNSEFGKLIAEENGQESNKSIRYDLVEDLYVSPAVKRQIWKTMQVLDEIEHAMGHPPKRIFVEMVREHKDSARSVTRKDSLMKLYESIKNESALMEQLKSEDNDKLRSDKLYLYYTQMGMCAYTGKRIDIDELMSGNTKYDIDHIYPQSQTADDSLDNRVLVLKNENERKQDIYPINETIQTRMKPVWLSWKDKKLITDEKYKRLTRTEELTAEELYGFVSRQLVETGQSTKAFMDVIKSIMPESTELVYSRAKNVSKFRHKFEIIKVRELNDLHHAKDAYLNIVVGNVFHIKFTKDVRKYFQNNGTYRTYNLNKMYCRDVESGGETAWIQGESGTISTVKKTLQSDKILVSRQTYERKGQLFDVNPLGRGKGQIPLKSGKGNERLMSIEKYGGYNSATISYFALIEGEDKKSRKQRYIAPVPLYLKDRFLKNQQMEAEYFAEMFKITNVRIIDDKIPMQTLFVCEGFRMRITARSENRLVFNNDNQLSMDIKYHKILKEISKFMADRSEKKEAVINEKSGITKEILEELYDAFTDKIDNTVYKEMMASIGKKIKEGREKFCDLSLENQAVQINEILKLFKCNPEMPDLSRIGGSKEVARIRISMNVTDRKNMILVHQSVTGLYEQIERVNE